MKPLKEKILFVTGKGGVGKSLVAAALAGEQASLGRRVLLVEIGETSYYQDFWGLNSVCHEPRDYGLGFDLALWSGETCLREYVLYYLKLERLYKLFFDNKVTRSLINIAPGLSEIAILGKITSGIRKVGPPLDYDLIVVDAYASGHAIALLKAPKGMREAIQFGPMGTHSREIETVLHDPTLTAYAIVTLLEELPVVETLELRQSMIDETGIKPFAVANKVLRTPLKSDALKGLEAAVGTRGLGEFASYLKAVLERQESFIRTLRENFEHVDEVPLIFSTDPKTLVSSAGAALRKH